MFILCIVFYFSFFFFSLSFSFSKPSLLLSAILFLSGFFFIPFLYPLILLGEKYTIRFYFLTITDKDGCCTFLPKIFERIPYSLYPISHIIFRSYLDLSVDNINKLLVSLYLFRNKSGCRFLWFHQRRMIL